MSPNSFRGEYSPLKVYRTYPVPGSIGGGGGTGISSGSAKMCELIDKRKRAANNKSITLFKNVIEPPLLNFIL